MPTSPGSSIQMSPGIPQQGVPLGTSSGNSSQSESSSQSGPYAPQYMGDAANAINDFTTSAKSAAADQKNRLMDFIKNLYSLRLQVMNQAKGAAARGAAGQQNPLDVYRAVNEMASQAGVPLQANISQALLQGNQIENTLNGLLSQAASHYTQLASIPQSKSQSTGAAQGGQVLNLGGGAKQRGQAPTLGYTKGIGGNFAGAIKDTDKVAQQKMDAETQKNNDTFENRARDETIGKLDQDINNIAPQNQNVQWNLPSNQPGYDFSAGMPESFGGVPYQSGQKVTSPDLSWNPPTNVDFNNSAHINYANDWLDMLDKSGGGIDRSGSTQVSMEDPQGMNWAMGKDAPMNFTNLGEAPDFDYSHTTSPLEEYPSSFENMAGGTPWNAGDESYGTFRDTSNG